MTTIFCRDCMDYVAFTFRPRVSGGRAVCGRCDTEDLYVPLDEYQSVVEKLDDLIADLRKVHRTIGSFNACDCDPYGEGGYRTSFSDGDFLGVLCPTIEILNKHTKKEG